jgi:hypothetical protein
MGIDEAKPSGQALYFFYYNKWSVDSTPYWIQFWLQFENILFFFNFDRTDSSYGYITSA